MSVLSLHLHSVLSGARIASLWGIVGRVACVIEGWGCWRLSVSPAHLVRLGRAPVCLWSLGWVGDILIMSSSSLDRGFLPVDQ